MRTLVGMEGVAVSDGHGLDVVLLETLPNVCAQQFCPLTLDESLWLVITRYVCGCFW